MGNRTQIGRSPKAAKRARCTCEWSGLGWHDGLLQLESQGLDGIGALVSAWAAERDEVSDGTITSAEFETFVAGHDWRDAGRMYSLARDLTATFERYRREGSRTRTAFEHEVAIVRAKGVMLRASGQEALADDLDRGISEVVAWIENRQSATL